MKVKRRFCVYLHFNDEQFSQRTLAVYWLTTGANVNSSVQHLRKTRQKWYEFDRF